MIIAEPFVKDGTYHRDYMRVVQPNETDKLIESGLSAEAKWNSFGALNKVFRHPEGPTAGTPMADSITSVLITPA